MDILFMAFLLFGGVLVYLLPSIVASKRHHRNKNSVFIVNLFFGWTLIAWVGCLAVAVSGNTAAEAK